MSELLPAWSIPAAGSDPVPTAWPAGVDREWAWGGSTGAGVRVCIVDSGVDAEHPLVGALSAAVAVERGPDGGLRVGPDLAGDVSGHGTACAGIIRGLAPDCEISSVRVLGADLTGGGPVLLTGLRWAVEQGFDVVNLSLSTRKRAFLDALREMADAAWFGRTLLVASAHNAAVESYPWRFPSVLSVGSHDASDPLEYHVNPRPPVEFFGRGVDVDIAWHGGGRTVATGNSFATPHLAGICALIRGKHPELLPYEIKTVLRLTATNAS